ncbi:MAG: thermonuclease family protein [Desulfobacteraceae bacterium]|nr:thermonuclease family protein [Desulfobacteraceae bacterium]
MGLRANLAGKAIEIFRLIVLSSSFLVIPPHGSAIADVRESRNSSGVYEAEAEAIIFQRGENLWIMDSDGKNQKQLTKEGIDAWGASRNGKIVYKNEEFQCFVIFSPESGAAKEFADDCLDAAISPDGSKIAYVKVAERLTDAEKMKKKREGFEDRLKQFDSAKKTVVFSYNIGSGIQKKVVGPLSSRILTLTEPPYLKGEPNWIDGGLFWSDNGRKLYFTRNLMPYGETGVPPGFILNDEDGQINYVGYLGGVFSWIKEKVLRGAEGEYFLYDIRTNQSRKLDCDSGDISSDGNKIVCTWNVLRGNAVERTEIIVQNLLSEEATTLLASDVNEHVSNPSWCLDGKKIAFVKSKFSRQGLEESSIWTIRADGSRPQKLADDASRPKWTRYSRNSVGESSKIIETTISDIVDGDTLEVIYGGEKKQVRLIGIDTPETVVNDKTLHDASEWAIGVQKVLEMGEEATSYVENIVKKGDQIRIEFDDKGPKVDPHNRLLGYVYLRNGQFLNAELLKNGYARTFFRDWKDGREFEQKKYNAEFQRIEDEARRKRVGFWKIWEKNNLQFLGNGESAFSTPFILCDDRLNCDPRFKTILDDNPGLDATGSFEVISLPDATAITGGIAKFQNIIITTKNMNAYFFSYKSDEITLSDWVDYLASIKNKYGSIGRLTIFAHGNKGYVDLAKKAPLTSSNIKSSTVRTQLERLKKENILASNAHILLFSCLVAEDENFVQELADLTGAWVHANKQRTGRLRYFWHLSDFDLETVKAPRSTLPDHAQPESIGVQITSTLKIVQALPYKVGQTITARFSIKNMTTTAVTFDVLTVGGRLNGICPQNECPDFEWKRNIHLEPNAVYNYEGKLRLEATGNYHFFAAYRTKDGQWNTAIPTVPDATNTMDINVLSVPGVTGVMGYLRAYRVSIANVWSF